MAHQNPRSNRANLPKLGKWGQLFLSSLKKNDPKQFRGLLAAGELYKVAASIDRTASAEFLGLFNGLLKQEPPAKDSADRLAQAERCRRVAEEVVSSEVIVPDPMWERQQREGYTDENTADWNIDEPFLPKPPNLPRKTP